MLMEKQKQNFEMLAAVNGISLDETNQENNEELPPEILEMEREFQKRKAERSEGSPSTPSIAIKGLGYAVE